MRPIHSNQHHNERDQTLIHTEKVSIEEEGEKTTAKVKRKTDMQ